MAAAAGIAYAVLAPNRGGSAELFRSPVTRAAWARVGQMTAASPILAVSGRAAWFANGTFLTNPPATGFAAPPGRPQVITLAAVSGGSFLHTSANGAKTWTTSMVGNSEPLNSLAYANQTTGWVVLGWPGPNGRHELLRTTNAGRTWQQVSF